MIARIEFDYDSGQKMRAMIGKPDRADDLARLCAVLHVSPPSERDAEWWHVGETLIDLDTDGPLLVAMGLQFIVKSFKGTMPLTMAFPDAAAGRDVTIYVQVPNIGLLVIDEVKVCEDYCTYALQSELDNGWRILAICPPNAARRPDYIMGRPKDQTQRDGRRR